MTILLNRTTLVLTARKTDVHISHEGRTYTIRQETLGRTAAVLAENVATISVHYRGFAKLAGMDNRYQGEVNAISLKIALHYLEQYSRFRQQLYPKSRYDIPLNPKDLEHPQTYDMVIRHLREQSLPDWEAVAATLLNMSPGRFADYQEQRQHYFNK